MTAGTFMVPLVGLGLLGACGARHWAQRITRRDAVLHRLRGGHAGHQPFPALGVSPALMGRRWLVLSPLMVVPLGMAAGVGAFSLVVALAASATMVLVRQESQRREPARYERALTAALDSLARQLRAGDSLRVGLVQVADDAAGPLGEDLRMLHASLDRGELFTVALQRWAARRPVPAISRVAAGLGVGFASGSLRARHVEALADGLRQDQQVQREATSWAAQAQASALIMVVSPLAFSLLLASGDPAVRGFFLHGPLGLACLAIGLALDLAAAAFMTHMVAVVR
ncbi:MAG: type II secretion system F family protein [Acidimicrobiales bacterium]